MISEVESERVTWEEWETDLLTRMVFRMEYGITADEFDTMPYDDYTALMALHNQRLRQIEESRSGH